MPSRLLLFFARLCALVAASGLVLCAWAVRAGDYRSALADALTAAVLVIVSAVEYANAEGGASH